MSISPTSSTSIIAYEEESINALSKPHLSPSDILQYFYNSCDLYLYKRHYTSRAPYANEYLDRAINESEHPQSQQGRRWEEEIFERLTERGQLYSAEPSKLRDAGEIIQFFMEIAKVNEVAYVSGLAFQAPSFTEELQNNGYAPDSVVIGVFKPDLIKVECKDGVIIWEVVDIKASRAVSAGHNAQIGIYHICLEKLLGRWEMEMAERASPPYEAMIRPSSTISIWLLDDEEEMESIKSTSTTLILPPLRDFLFRKLPHILSIPKQSSLDEIDWRFKSACRSCQYVEECEARTKEDKRLGSINFSAREARDVSQVLKTARENQIVNAGGTDIEDLGRIIQSKRGMKNLERIYPGTMKRVARVLNIQDGRSPAVDAVLNEKPELIANPVLSFPRHEDIAIYLSVVGTKGDPENGRWAINIYLRYNRRQPDFTYHGPLTRLVPQVAQILRWAGTKKNGRTLQFFTYSEAEHTAIIEHIIQEARHSETVNADLRLCIDALCDDQRVLRISYHPLLLSGSLHSFFHKPCRFSRNDLQTLCFRLGIDSSGHIDDLLSRLKQRKEELERDVRRISPQICQTGQLPRIVVIKREMDRLISLPFAGAESLSQTADALGVKQPDLRFYQGAYDHQDSELEQRNSYMHGVVANVRNRLLEGNLEDKVLLNVATVPQVDNMDVFRNPILRKLAFMSQQEILSKLENLWKDRLRGSLNQPQLRYISRKQDETHQFEVISGTIDTGDDPFSKYLLVPKEESVVGIEMQFDDLPMSDLYFPCSNDIDQKWEQQTDGIQNSAFVAKYIDSNNGYISLNLYPPNRSPVDGRVYKLVPRLIDFNTEKILGNLVNIDLRSTTDSFQPFVQLISNPLVFASAPSFSCHFPRGESPYQGTTAEIHRRGGLELHPSQENAFVSLLSRKLTIIWGPPGTGKTHTMALSTLKMLQLMGADASDSCKFILATALTNAAVDILVKKFQWLIACYQRFAVGNSSWLDKVKIEVVTNAWKHPEPEPSLETIYIYAGTPYQLWRFFNRMRFVPFYSEGHKADLVLIDEASQLKVADAALVIRWLSPEGKLVLAGDHLQLAPIVEKSYPILKPIRLFGSILDAVLSGLENGQAEDDHGLSRVVYHDPVTQLQENFRLNKDLGRFIERIYSKAFIPQKEQSREIAANLRQCLGDYMPDRRADRSATSFLLALSDAMLPTHEPLATQPLYPPTTKVTSKNHSHRPISMALIRTNTHLSQDLPRERHVEAEAELASSLVAYLWYCFPDKTIFVATPFHVQRRAVTQMTAWTQNINGDATIDGLTELMYNMRLSGNCASGKQRLCVDTVERLQGSEADFVIFLLSHTHLSSQGDYASFLLDRRRLNVGISRAKSLCIVITSDNILNPSLTTLSQGDTREGANFLHAFAERAWSQDITI